MTPRNFSSAAVSTMTCCTFYDYVEHAQGSLPRLREEPKSIRNGIYFLCLHSSVGHPMTLHSGERGRAAELAEHATRNKMSFSKHRQDKLSRGMECRTLLIHVILVTCMHAKESEKETWPKICTRLQPRKGIYIHK